MIATMEKYGQESRFRKWWNSLDFLHKRVIRMLLSLMAMILCFPLYYLGLFGSVEGPLNPARIGQALAGLGVSKTDAKVFFLVFLIIAGTWNWVYNIVSHIIGARLTCNKVDEAGKVCGARAERRRIEHKKTGKAVAQYVCAEGHKRSEAHFHPVQKGKFSNTLWVIALIFCGIVFLLS